MPVDHPNVPLLPTGPGGVGPPPRPKGVGPAQTTPQEVAKLKAKLKIMGPPAPKPPKPIDDRASVSGGPSSRFKGPLNTAPPKPTKNPAKSGGSGMKKRHSSVSLRGMPAYRAAHGGGGISSVPGGGGKAKGGIGPPGIPQGYPAPKPISALGGEFTVSNADGRSLVFEYGPNGMPRRVKGKLVKPPPPPKGGKQEAGLQGLPPSVDGTGWPGGVPPGLTPFGGTIYGGPLLGNVASTVPIPRPWTGPHGSKPIPPGPMPGPPESRGPPSLPEPDDWGYDPSTGNLLPMWKVGGSWNFAPPGFNATGGSNQNGYGFSGGGTSGTVTPPPPTPPPEAQQGGGLNPFPTGDVFLLSNMSPQDQSNILAAAHLGVHPGGVLVQPPVSSPGGMTTFGTMYGAHPNTDISSWPIGPRWKNPPGIPPTPGSGNAAAGSGAQGSAGKGGPGKSYGTGPSGVELPPLMHRDGHRDFTSLDPRRSSRGQKRTRTTGRVAGSAGRGGRGGTRR